MFKCILIVVCLFLTSCCQTYIKIKYKYKNIVITRIDECGKTSFYYNDSLTGAGGKIWIEYSGINDGFSGYLKFDDNGQVTLLSGDGYFRFNHLDTTKFIYKRIYSYDKPTVGNSVCYITLAIEYEKKRNAESKSAIKIEYDINHHKLY